MGVTFYSNKRPFAIRAYIMSYALIVLLLPKHYCIFTTNYKLNKQNCIDHIMLTTKVIRHNLLLDFKITKKKKKKKRRIEKGGYGIKL
jgi:hypothetical protein